MPPKSSRKRTRLDFLIPDGQDSSSQQFYIAPAAALRDAPASVIPPRLSTETLCHTSISDDRRRIFCTSIPLQPTGDAPLFGDVLYPDLGEDFPDAAPSSVPADYFNTQDDSPEDPDTIVHAVDDATRELEISVRALVAHALRSSIPTRCIPIGRGHEKLASTA